MLLALDLDGVVADLAPGLAARVAARFGLALHPASGAAYDLAGLGLPPRERRAFLDEVFADPALYDEAPPCAGALAGTRALTAAGWRLVAVGAGHGWIGPATE